ncbi:MAG TPA: TldD/PmbA family protein [Dehalococcoidia bacterium]|nr:TldD/PmbA family protein [Dehalococcoidia bacterium]
MERLNAILEIARANGAQQAEAFHVDNEESPVKFEANRLKELNSRRTSGVALRVIKDGRVGFASSTRPGDIEDLVKAAIETSPFGPEAHFDFPRQAEAPIVDTFDPETETFAIDNMIETGQQVIDAVRGFEPELLCDAQLRRTVGTVTLANSKGGSFTYRGSMLMMWLHGVLIHGTDMLFVGDVDASASPRLDTQRIKETITWQLEHCRTNAKVRTAELPVIFTSSGVADALLMPLTMAFSGRLVHQGQSPLAGKLSEELYDTRFSLRDDATLHMRPASRPFDDEGVASRQNVMIDKGVVSNFLYDLQTAGLAAAASTGSAERSLASQPSISPSNLIIAAGETSFEDMVSSVKEGLIVEDLMGAGQGNVLGGDFSGNVLLGYKIESGEIVGRVKDTVVAANVHDALRRLSAIGDEARWVNGTVYTPPLLFESMAVSAKSS